VYISCIAIIGARNEHEDEKTNVTDEDGVRRKNKAFLQRRVLYAFSFFFHLNSKSIEIQLRRTNRFVFYVSQVYWNIL
jgi:hypothetical protein